MEGISRGKVVFSIVAHRWMSAKINWPYSLPHTSFQCLLAEMSGGSVSAFSWE